MTRFDGQALIFDADDTLWENNVYFERAIDAFVDWLGHSTLTPAEVRAALDEVERVTVRTHGYGSKSFGHSLRELGRHLRERDLDDEEVATVSGFARQVMAHPMELLPGVEATLGRLGGRHRLFLLTKGNDEEQRLKIDSSGLHGVFEHAMVVPEKDPAAYRRVVEDLALDPATTWMIGNSPSSDINPSLAAGLSAVFIPHDLTWRLEHADLAEPAPPSRLVTVERFPDLLDHFAAD
jgi:putative hydrolase of the HAD superfamily